MITSVGVLDHADQVILSALASNPEGKLCLVADRVGLDVAECERRVSELKSRGYILQSTFNPGYPGGEIESSSRLVRVDICKGHSGADILKSLRFVPEARHVDILEGNNSLFIMLVNANSPRVNEIEAFLARQLSVAQIDKMPLDG